MDKFTHITVPILNDDYIVIVAWGDKRKAIPYLTKRTGTDEYVELLENARGVYWTSKKDHCLPFIYIALPTKDEHFISTVAHEAVHAADCIFEHIGEEGGKEVFAHCVGAIVFAVCKELRK